MKKSEKIRQRNTFDMSVSKSKSFKRTFAYPDQTKGSQIAAEIREEANKLSEEEREKHFNRGMQIIYGGSHRAKQAAGRRH